jgi:hypothetical protein
MQRSGAGDRTAQFANMTDKNQHGTRRFGNNSNVFDLFRGLRGRSHGPKEIFNRKYLSISKIVQGKAPWSHPCFSAAQKRRRKFSSRVRRDALRILG